MNRSELRELIKESITGFLESGNKVSKKTETTSRDSLKSLVKIIINEVIEDRKKNLNKKIDKEDGSYDPQGVKNRVRMEKERPDGKSFEEILKKLTSVAKSIDPKIIVSFDDHKDFNVELLQSFRVRISPRWENNFDVDASVANNDRIRVIGLTLDQVCDFIKENFTEKVKDAVQKSFSKVDKNREDQSSDGKIDKDLKNTNPVKEKKVSGDSKAETLPKNEDDGPGAPMKEVDMDKVKPQRDFDEFKPKAPKHKNDEKLVIKMPGKEK